MDAVSVLHLSDLHFGENSRFSDQDPVEIASSFARTIKVECRRIELSVDLVIVTGDIVETALPKEFTAARKFFEQLSLELEVDPRRFVFVPGNHDVSWFQCRRAELDVEESGLESGKLREMMDAKKLRPFDEAIRSFQGIRREEVGTPIWQGAFAYEFPLIDCSVMALNSCERESHRPEDHIGYLSKEQAQAAMDYWSSSTLALRLIAIHHNPVPTVPKEVTEWLERLASHRGELSESSLQRFASDAVGFEGREHLEVLAEDCQVQLVLHGHHHVVGRQPIAWQQGKKGATHVLSAGSWGLGGASLPAEQENAVQLVRLDPKAGELRAWTMVYSSRARSEGSVSPGKFVLDGGDTSGFVQDLYLPKRLKREPRKSNSDMRVAPRVTSGPTPARRRLPDNRASITHRFEVSEYGGVFTVGLYEDGMPGEIYIRLDKEGSTISGLLDTIAVLSTTALQHGVPLETLVDDLAHMRFEPSGFTRNPEIPFAKSISDYLGRWLASRFLSREDKVAAGVIVRDY